MKKNAVHPIDRVIEIAQQKGLSMPALEREAGIGKDTLRKARDTGGPHALSLPTLDKIVIALGCTLAELLGIKAEQGEGGAFAQLGHIRPSPLNPRKTFDEAGIAELAASIAANGLLQNLVVREVPGGLAIVAGERRYRALKLLSARGQWPADKPTVPVRIVTANDAQHLSLALLENLQRVDVNPMEEAEAFAELRRLDPKKWSADGIAKAIGKSKRYVEQRLSMLAKLAPEAQQALRDGKLSTSQARVLTMANADEQVSLLKRADEMSVLEMRNAVTNGMIPVQRAIFDVAASGLATIEADNGLHYFTDRDGFLALQLKAAKKRVKELTKQQAWALLRDRGEFLGNFEPAKDAKLAGTLVSIDHNGIVTEQGGLVRSVHRAITSASDLEKAAAHRENAEKQQAIDAALGDLAKAVDHAINGLPQWRMRLAFMMAMLERNSGAEYGLDEINELAAAVLGVGDLVDSRGELLEQELAGQAWQRLCRVKTEDLADALALCQGNIPLHHWVNQRKRLSLAGKLLCRSLKIGIPPELLDDQTDIEDAGNAKKVA